MKKAILILVALIGSLANARGQSDSASADTAWKIGGNFGLQFNQAAYSNWQAGGVNSISGNGLVNLFALYDNGGQWTWDNDLTLGYGLNFQDSIFNKTDDRIELESRVDRQFNKNWSMSAFLNFRSQFAPGFSQPGETADSLKISDWLAPAYILNGVGFTYKHKKVFSLFLSPLTGKYTIVNNDRLAAAGAFGVEPGEKFRAELGGLLNAQFKKEIMKNVNLTSRLSLYSNYLVDPTLIDVNASILVFFKVNEFITANISLNSIYDHDVKFDVDEDGVTDGPRLQFREIIGIGLTYQFGDEKKKDS